VELCEPCNRLVKLIGKREILRGLVHRGGLRADILSDGQIAAGDAVQAL
jgi:MOSC domain-containing protein YiiM